jgi:hypothetical protein
MIAANANTVFKAISYCDVTGLIAYAANNNVLMLDPYNTVTKEGEEPTVVPKVLYSLNC